MSKSRTIGRRLRALFRYGSASEIAKLPHDKVGKIKHDCAEKEVGSGLQYAHLLRRQAVQDAQNAKTQWQQT
jgi:hypothetical protein